MCLCKFIQPLLGNVFKARFPNLTGFIANKLNFLRFIIFGMTMKNLKAKFKKV